jgi:predicted DNA-binding helix-hairpin-helix protein
MTDIKQIKIIGIDEERPPMLRKEGYIDLYFKLSVKAPEDWCDEYNKLGNRLTPRVKINPAVGLIIETYVHDVNQIQAHLDRIKEQIKACTTDCLEKVRQKQLALAAKSAAQLGVGSKQDELNVIIAGLNYDN